MSRLMGLLAVILFTGHAGASLLTLTPGTGEKSGIAISAGAEAVVDGAKHQLTTVGHGLRQKKVIFWVDVYVGQLLLGQPAQLVKTEDGALASLSQQPVVVMHFTFKRTVEAEKIAESFRDALAANGVDLTADAEMNQLMDAVARMGEVRSGQTLAFVIVRNADGTETVVYENASAAQKTHAMKTSAGAMQKLLSMWLGQPADEGVARFKSELLN